VFIFILKKKAIKYLKKMNNCGNPIIYSIKHY